VDKNEAFIRFCKHAQLDPNYTDEMRSFLRLKYLEERPLHEISGFLGIPVKQLEVMDAEALRNQRRAQGMQ